MKERKMPLHAARELLDKLTAVEVSIVPDDLARHLHAVKSSGYFTDRLQNTRSLKQLEKIVNTIELVDSDPRLGHKHLVG